MRPLRHAISCRSGRVSPTRDGLPRKGIAVTAMGGTFEPIRSKSHARTHGVAHHTYVNISIRMSYRWSSCDNRGGPPRTRRPSGREGRKRSTNVLTGVESKWPNGCCAGGSRIHHPMRVRTRSGRVSCRAPAVPARSSYRFRSPGASDEPTNDGAGADRPISRRCARTARLPRFPEVNPSRNAIRLQFL